MGDTKQWFSNLNSKSSVHFDILVSHNQQLKKRGQGETEENRQQRELHVPSVLWQHVPVWYVGERVSVPGYDVKYTSDSDGPLFKQQQGLFANRVHEGTLTSLGRELSQVQEAAPQTACLQTGHSSRSILSRVSWAETWRTKTRQLSLSRGSAGRRRCI